MKRKIIEFTVISSRYFIAALLSGFFAIDILTGERNLASNFICENRNCYGKEFLTRTNYSPVWWCSGCIILECIY